MTLGLDYEVRPGQEAAFEDLYRAVAALMASVPGHVRTRLDREVDGPNRYLMHSEWRDRESFTAFVRSEAFSRVTARGLLELLAGPPHHRLYTAST